VGILQRRNLQSDYLQCNMAVKFRKNLAILMGQLNHYVYWGFSSHVWFSRGYRKVKPMIQDGYSRTSNAAIAVPSKVAWSQCSFHQCSEAAVIPLPSGKHTKNYGNIHHFQWVIPLKIAIFNSSFDITRGYCIDCFIGFPVHGWFLYRMNY